MDQQVLPKKIQTKLSIHMSTILRHQAKNMGIEIDQGGYVRMQDLIAHINLVKSLKNITLDHIHNTVKSNEKNRFSLKVEDGQEFIRANQGHSIKGIKSEQLLQPLTVESVSQQEEVFHATYLKVWPLIKQQGLKIMNRIHLHMRSFEKGKIPKRNDCDLYIHIDILAAMKDGVEFYISKNGDILTQGDKQGTISPKYFVKAINSQQEKLEL